MSAGTGRWPRNAGAEGMGARTHGFNQGSAAIALLGVLTAQEATLQARASLVALLAALAAVHGIDPPTVASARSGPARVTAPTV